VSGIKKIIHSITSFFYLRSDLYLEELSKYLDNRQMKIVKLKLKGYKNIEIADKLEVCPATITNEFKRIRKILETVGYKIDLLKD
jgi:DNA-binding NarL/FixJ family response regulator